MVPLFNYVGFFQTVQKIWKYSLRINSLSRGSSGLLKILRLSCLSKSVSSTLLRLPPDQDCFLPLLSISTFIRTLNADTGVIFA